MIGKGKTEKQKKNSEELFLRYRFDNNTQPIKNAEVIKIQNKVVCTLGNFSIITGKPKSRKSVFVGSILSAALINRPVFDITVNVSKDSKIIYIDTEQNNYNLSKSIENIKKHCTGYSIDNLITFQFRGLDSNLIIENLDRMIEYYTNIELIIIDGLLDLITDFNSIVEAKILVSKLIYWSDTYNVCIIGVLHQSKGNNFTIGHLGSFVDRKAEAVLEVIKNDDDTTTLKPVMMRSDANFNNDITIYYNNEIKNYSLINTSINNNEVLKQIIGPDKITNVELQRRLKIKYPTKSDKSIKEIIEYGLKNQFIFINQDKKIQAYG